MKRTARTKGWIAILAIILGWLGIGLLQGAEPKGAQTSGDYDIQAAKQVAVVNVEARLDLDAYGGSKRIQGQATGWFALQRIKDRWWLVTPDGNGMISLGVVHIGQALQQPIYQAAYQRDQTACMKDVADNLRQVHRLLRIASTAA